MLDANPELAVFPETWCYVILDRFGCLKEFKSNWQYRLFLQQVWQNLISYNDPAARIWAEEASKHPSYVGPTAPVLQHFGDAYAKARGALLWGEKTPGHILWLRHIKELFPNAKVIVTVRDPRDVIVSYDDRWGAGRRDDDFLMSTAALIRYYLRKFFDEPGYAPDRFHLVKYEELTSNPGTVLRAVCRFLEIEFQPAMVDFHDRSANWIAGSEAKHHAMLAKPASTERIARYKKALSDRQIAAIDEFLHEEMRCLGYEGDRASQGIERSTYSRVLANAQKRYEQMRGGVFRKRMRRRGKLVLNAYKIGSRCLALSPRRRVARSSDDWAQRASAISLAEHTQSQSRMGQTVDLDLMGITEVPHEPGTSTGSLGETEQLSSVPDPEKFRQNIGQISRHSAVFFAGTVFTGIAGYLFKIYLARTIGANALGVYALGMTIVALLGVFNGLGLPQSAVRFVAHYCATRQSNLLRGFLLRSSTLLLSTNIILASALVMVGPWLARHIYHTSELDPYFILFAFIMLVGALTNLGGQILQGYKDVSRRTLITNFIGTPLVIVLTIALLMRGRGLWGYLVAQVLGACVVLCLLIMAVRKLTPPDVFRQVGPLPPLGRQVLVFGMAALGISILEFLLAQTDKILIGFYLNPREVGIYAVAMTVVAFVPIALQSVNQIFSPTISDLHSRGEHQLLEKLFQTLTKWIFAFTLPLSIAIIIFAKPLMGIFGVEFAVGWPVLVIGTLGQLINCGTGSVGYLLLMSGHQNRLIKVQAVMAVTLIVFDLLLIPKWGIMGAVTAAALTNAGTNLLNLLQVRSSLSFTPYNRTYFRLVPAAMLTTAATLLLRREFSNATNLVTIMFCITAGYIIFGTTLLFSGLDTDDRLIAEAVWSRLRGNWRRTK